MEDDNRDLTKEEFIDFMVSFFQWEYEQEDKKANARKGITVTQSTEEVR